MVFSYSKPPWASQEAESAILKEPFLFDLDVLRAIFDKAPQVENRLLGLPLSSTRPTPRTLEWDSVETIHVYLTSSWPLHNQRPMALLMEIKF